MKDVAEGFTALIKASDNGYLEVVKALVAAGADINAKNNVGGWGYRSKLTVYHSIGRGGGVIGI